jgi:hypothetical protein
MRLALVLFLLAAPLLAEEQTLASRLPPGATAFVEARGLGAKVDALLASPLGRKLKEHPATQAFLESPQGRKLQLGEAFLRGATGLDFLGVFKAVAGKEIAAAIYGKPQRALLLARVDPAVVERLLAGVEMLSQNKRATVAPADESGPAIWRVGPAFVVLDGAVLAVTPDEELAKAVRARAPGGKALREARRYVGDDADLFGYVDLAAYQALIPKDRMPKDLGQALILGVFAHYVPQAPWASFGIRFEQRGNDWAVAARGYVPMPAEPAEPVAEAYGGTLGPLPFKLPPRTLGVVRLRRDLESVWSNRDALIDERGIPGLVQFETNFGNLTAGMSWVDEFLPNIGDEFILVGSRPVFEAGKAAPAVRYPQGAILWPIRNAEKFAVRLQLAYQTLVFILNQQAAQMNASPLLNSIVEYKGVRCHVARYMPPEDAEMEGREALPARYNFTPSAAVVGDYLVIASTESMLRDLIDGREGTTAAPAHVNAGVWLEPAEIRALLAENRSALIANTMLEKGVDRAEAARRIDLALDLGQYVRSFSLTATESRATVGVALDLVVGTAGE